MNSDRNLSRRVLLKGLGFSVALPWLEAARIAAPPGRLSGPANREASE